MINIESRDFYKGADNCSLRITRIGQEFCSLQKKPEKIKRDYYSLHFVLFGSGTLKFGNSSYKVKAGSAFLLYEGIEYEYYPDPQNPWTYVWVDVYGENLDELFERAGFLRSDPVVKIKKMDEINLILRNLNDAYSYDFYGEMAYYGYLFLLIDRLVDNNSAFIEQSKKKVLNKKLIRNILIFMNNNSTLDLTPKDIGQKFNISYGTLMGLFKSEVGMAPMQYLANFRIAHACMLLRSEDKMSVGEISRAVGYTDQLYFSRLFKKLKGVSPSEYQKSDIEDDPYEWLKTKDLDFR